jgi:hypothetical protein
VKEISIERKKLKFTSTVKCDGEAEMSVLRNLRRIEAICWES